MKYIIYLIKNKINNKVYVGLTSQTLKKRWSDHSRKAKYQCKNSNGNYFQRAIVKYGKENWSLEILENCDSLKNAEIAETKWIAHFKSNQKEFGYNLTEGGNVSQSSLDPRVKEKIAKSVSELWKNPDYKQNAIDKMKQWHQENDNPSLGMKHTEETLNKLSKIKKQWHQENDNPFLNKKHTDETKKRMSEAAQRRCADPNWIPPCIKYGFSDEVRKKMSESAKKRPRFSNFGTKKDFIELAKQCKSQKEMSDKLGCTAANVAFLLKRWNIKEEIKNILKQNKENS